MQYIFVIPIVTLIAGFVTGYLVSSYSQRLREEDLRDIADEMIRNSESRRQDERDLILERIRESFGNLSLEALQRASDTLIDMAGTHLERQRDLSSREMEEKKTLIDQQLQRMTLQLKDVSSLVRDLERDRENKFGELTSQLKRVGEETTVLTQVTGDLQKALSNTQVRGQWGERMADDVLRMMGLSEGVNYVKQKSVAGGTARPDFTFLLPKDLTLNMDVKFPFNNFIRLLQSSNDMERTTYRKAFRKDVKAKIQEVTGREYIDPEGSTLDYVLLFIPNEQIYSFIQEEDRDLLDEGLRRRVVCCSPITLYAVLAVIRQAVDNFAVERRADEMLSLMGTFRKQWGEFVKRMDTMGKRLEQAQREYDALVGTRRRQLERPLEKLEDLRIGRNLPDADEKEREDAIEKSHQE